jgi:hypothetical protein
VPLAVAGDLLGGAAHRQRPEHHGVELRRQLIISVPIRRRIHRRSHEVTEAMLADFVEIRPAAGLSEKLTRGGDIRSSIEILYTGLGTGTIGLLADDDERLLVRRPPSLGRRNGLVNRTEPNPLRPVESSIRLRMLRARTSATLTPDSLRQGAT